MLCMSHLCRVQHEDLQLHPLLLLCCVVVS